MTSDKHRSAFRNLFDLVMPSIPEDAELRIKACGDFLMVDIFAVTSEGILTSKVSYHYQDGTYQKFTSNMHTKVGFEILVKYTKELYQPDRQLSFIAELLDVNLQDMARIMKELRKEKK